MGEKGVREKFVAVDKQPKTPTALAIPLWVIAIALLLIAGAVAFQGYVELQRQKVAAAAAAAALEEATRVQTSRGSASKLPRIQFTNASVAKPVVIMPRVISTPSRALPVPPLSEAVVPPTKTNAVAAVPAAKASAAELPAGVSLRILAVPFASARDARITGRVLFTDTPPPETPLPLDPACGLLRVGVIPTTRNFVRGTNGGLADVLVFVSKGLEGVRYEVPSYALTLSQSGCEFSPFVAAVRAGQRISIRNADRVLHYPHGVPAAGGNREFYLSQPPKAADLEFVLPQPELFVRVKCEVHSWMIAHVSVLDHPFFFVTDANGSFRLPAPPPGRYEITAQHLKAGIKTQTIDIEAGKGLEVELRFGGGR